MLKVLGKLPREVGVAVSGGPDSMAILDFLSNNHGVTACYFDHGTDFGKKCKRFVKNFCDKKDIPLVIGINYNSCPPKNPWKSTGVMSDTSSSIVSICRLLRVIT